MSVQQFISKHMQYSRKFIHTIIFHAYSTKFIYSSFFIFADFQSTLETTPNLIVLLLIRPRSMQAKMQKKEKQLDYFEKSFIENIREITSKRNSKLTYSKRYPINNHLKYCMLKKHLYYWTIFPFFSTFCKTILNSSRLNVKIILGFIGQILHSLRRKMYSYVKMKLGSYNSC